jgi:hypothetical protein
MSGEIREGAANGRRLLSKDIETLLKWALYAKLQADAPVQLIKQIAAAHMGSLTARQTALLAHIAEQARQTRMNAEIVVNMIDRMHASVARPPSHDEIASWDETIE